MGGRRKCGDAMCSAGEPTACWDQRLSELEHDAELAVLIAITNLPAGDPPAYSWFPPEAAVRRLPGSVSLWLPVNEVRHMVTRTVRRAWTDAFLGAASDPSECWGLLNLRPAVSSSFPLPQSEPDGRPIPPIGVPWPGRT